ncbi:AFUA_2G17970 family ergot alkaloid biosynthesis protein [Diaporthe eres]|nr:AFUA_2G17970 family ergot alkaloid biosynthesis protein [Diaporthe eres]
MISGKAVLLTGDMGKEGQRLTALLAEMSISTIQTFRSGETTTEPDASNVKAITFDWNDECIWNTALAESQPHSGNSVASQFLDMLPPMERLIDLARSKTDFGHSPGSQSQIRAAASTHGWVDFVRSIGPANLSGRGFGEIV